MDGTPAFDEDRYKKRNTVERTINRLKPPRDLTPHMNFYATRQ